MASTSTPKSDAESQKPKKKGSSGWFGSGFVLLQGARGISKNEEEVE